MGAGGKFQYPKEVWSPAGGWWAYPKNWRVNTVGCFALITALSIPIFLVSESKSRRPHKPTKTIPWRKSLGSKEDDE